MNKVNYKCQTCIFGRAEEKEEDEENEEQGK